MKATSPLHELEALRAAGAARVDAIGLHYIEKLAQRTQQQSGLAQQLLLTKLHVVIERLETRMRAAIAPHAEPVAKTVVTSPMAALLQQIHSTSGPHGAGKTAGWQAETPSIQQFRKKLNRISVQKQVTQAIAQAPQNPGPINSHMLVLRSLGLMRDISPDYLNHFMVHINSLLKLEQADQGKATSVKKSTAVSKRVA